MNIAIYVAFFFFGFWMGFRFDRKIVKRAMEELATRLYTDLQKHYVMIPRHQDITVETVDEETGETRKGKARVSDIDKESTRVERKGQGNGFNAL